MITRLVIEIDHEDDIYPDWPEGDDWNAVELREYIEEEGTGGITVLESQTNEGGRTVANPERINNGTMAYNINQAGD